MREDHAIRVLRFALQDQCHAQIAESIEEALRRRVELPDDVLRGTIQWLQASMHHRQCVDRLRRLLDDAKAVSPIHGADCREERS